MPERSPSERLGPRLAYSENKPSIRFVCAEICTTFHGFRVPPSGMTTLTPETPAQYAGSVLPRMRY